MNQPDDEAARRSPARRGWIGGLTGVPPAGPTWRAGRFPPFTRYALVGLLASFAVALLLLSLGG